MMSYAQWGNALYSGKKSYGIIKNRRIPLTVGAILMAISVIGIALFGLNPSIEFTGGAEFVVTNTASNPPQQPAYDAVKAAGLNEQTKVAQMGTNGLRVQTSQQPTDVELKIQKELAKAYNVDISKVSKTSIGPSWGASVSKQALVGLLVFMGMIALLLMAYFRTWTMSFSALFALMHDFLITLGVFAYTQIEITPATIIGLLTILGYSLYDTVVVFDKIRENTRDMFNQSRSKYNELANLSINQTMVRSINTSITGILPVSAILFLGAALLGTSTLLDISMPLFIGMIVGTFSSIFIATPMLTLIRGRSQAIKDHNAKVDKARAAAVESGAATLNEDGSFKEVTPAVVAAPMVPGHHKGQAAQPKRKKTKK